MVACKFLNIGESKYQPCDKSFIPFPNKPWFLNFCSTTLLKTQQKKDKLLVPNNFSFFCCVFFLSHDFSASFIQFKIAVCQVFSVWKCLKFTVWERVKDKILSIQSHLFLNLIHALHSKLVILLFHEFKYLF